jgi:hypothetical protein
VNLNIQNSGGIMQRKIIALIRTEIRRIGVRPSRGVLPLLRARPKAASYIEFINTGELGGQVSKIDENFQGLSEEERKYIIQQVLIGLSDIDNPVELTRVLSELRNIIELECSKTREPKKFGHKQEYVATAPDYISEDLFALFCTAYFHVKDSEHATYFARAIITPLVNRSKNKDKLREYLISCNRRAREEMFVTGQESRQEKIKKMRIDYLLYKQNHLRGTWESVKNNLYRIWINKGKIIFTLGCSALGMAVGYAIVASGATILTAASGGVGVTAILALAGFGVNLLSKITNKQSVAQEPPTLI